MWTIATMTLALVIQPPVQRVSKLQRQAVKEDWRLVDLRYDQWCIETGSSELDAKLRKKLTRKYKTNIDERANCDVARFPRGRGHAVFVLDQTSPEQLQAAKDELQLNQWTVIRPTGVQTAATLVCVSKWAVSTSDVTVALEHQGKTATSVWEVGSCHPQ